MLLVPVIDLYQPGQPWRVSLFTPSGLPQRFAAQAGPSAAPGWSVSRDQTIPPGGRVEERCFLLIHQGQADVAWQAFHRFAHGEDFPAVGWLHEMRVHYYDFLSAADPHGRRGDGYEADARHFRRFRVGMATQHGYYPLFGDYLDPNRKTWPAMPTDKHGPAEMSLDKMRRGSRSLGRPAPRRPFTCTSRGWTMRRPASGSCVTRCSSKRIRNRTK